MFTIQAAVVPVVAAETQAAVSATDLALLAHANMLAAVVEGAKSSNAPMHITQDLYARMTAHGSKLVEGREELRQLVTRFTAVKGMSDQREVALGCPAGAPERKAGFFTDAAQVQTAPVA